MLNLGTKDQETIAGRVLDRTVALVLTVAPALVLGCAKPPPLPDGNHNLLLITLDTVRADYLEPYGYPRSSSPNLKAFADQALVFDRAYSTSPRTGPSHATMLTSRHPSSHGVLFNGIDLPGTIRSGSFTLAEHLRRQGFETGAVVSVSALDAASGFDRGFDDFTHERTRRDRHKPEAGGGAFFVTETARKWLRKHRRERFFLWVHYYEAHLPFHLEKRTCEALALDPCALVTFDSAMEGVHAIEDIHQAYRGEIHELDRHVGDLLSSLGDFGLAGNTVVAITADHGEYLGEHGQFGHQELFDEMLHVPLMIRAPDGEAGRRDDLISLVDLTPSLLALLDQPPLRGAEGHDRGFRRSRPEAAPELVFAEWRNHAPFLGERPAQQRDILISAQSTHAKVIHDLLFPGASMAFDLRTDADEAHNRFGDHGAPWTMIEQGLDEHLRSLPKDAAAIKRLTLDPDTVEALEALGYL